MQERREDIVLLHKEEYRRMMAKVWSLYDRVPERNKKKAQKVIDDWIHDKITYEELIKELEKLASAN